MLEALPPGRPPRLIGPYRLLARLGAGGMGEVHLACRADDPTADPHRMVAVKTVREDLEVDGDFRTRFRREIAAARTVDGPGVARLLDADADASSPWLATEYVPGPSLAEAVVRAGALPIEAVRALGAQLAHALDAVHRVQVLHRDLKPANVLLGAAGPKLIDFGIAQAFEATALTSTGLVVGSPGFMSPEHLVGSRAVVPASDVFCLGAVLAFAASGRGPFHDDEMAAVIFRISRAEADLDPVPEELRPVLARCLRLDPAERPSAAEVAELLGGGEPPEVFPWPAGVLSLLAESREAARRAGEAAASGAGVADLPTLGPVVPYSPTAMSDRPVLPPVPVERRRPWGAVVAGAVAVAVLATAGVVLLNRTDGQGGASTGGAGGPGTPSASSGTTAPATLSQVVLPYGGRGRDNDFGGAGTDRAYRPAGWSPWLARTEAANGSCALSPEVLVCSGAGGALVGLDAADGRELWSVPGRPDEFGIMANAQYPAVVGDHVHVTGAAGVTAYGLRDGVRKGPPTGPGPDWAPKRTDFADGVLYTTYFRLDQVETGASSGLVTAVRLDGGGGAGRELWRSPIDVTPEEIVAANGLVYLSALGTLVALDAGDGKEAGRAAEPCLDMSVHERTGSVVCRDQEADAVVVLDGGSLKRLRTFGQAVTVRPAVSAAGLVATVSGRRVTVYDLASGKQRWSAEPPVAQSEVGQVVFADDRVLTAASDYVVSYPAAGPGSDDEIDSFAPNLPDDFKAEAAGELMAAGGALFLALPDGLVVTGYLP
ncbi:protein kinase domain-containing protein [Streptomyces exfoliatus]|uniref:protein kinase domain-containing protein n=1 Tax=Streptomyces exfoliatus TaxID=1905 RepID=UPI0004C78DB8|nr:protein kinase [Streptomyces exfoliatus]